LGDTEGRVSLWRREEYGPKAPYDRQKWYQYPADLDRMAKDVEANADHDVCITTATYSEDIRKPHLTLQAQTVWCDADTCEPENFRLPPSYVVQSSPGRYQTYWVLDKPVRAAEASLAAKRIAHAHRQQGADISSWPSNKIMRVPGTSNTNYGFPTRVDGYQTEHIYSLSDILDAYKDVQIEETTTTVAKVEQYDRGDFLKAQEKLPADFPIELLTREPEIGPDGNRSETRWRLIAELVEAGLDDSEVLAIAWQAPAASKWKEDGRGEDGLRFEIAKERQRFNEKTASPEVAEVAVAEKPKPKTAKLRKPKPVHILSEEDRARAKKLWHHTWMGEYEAWLRGSLKVYNAPYHRAGGWSALSALLGDTAFIGSGERDIPLCIWTWTMGGSVTGKSEARAAMQDVIHKGYNTPHNPDIGDDASTGGLLEKLHKMSEQSAIFVSDEADGLIEEMTAQGGWKIGQMSKWTFLFDGRVPPQTRRGDTEGEWSDCVFNMYMSGTETGVMDALNRKMFATGFLTRMCWFIGDDIEIPKDQKGFRARQRTEKDRSPIAEWKHRFAGIRQAWAMKTMGTGNRPYIQAEREEDDQFFQDMTASIEESELSRNPNWDIIKPSIIRLSTTMYKMAALLAISAGRSAISRDDMLVALYQGEELLGNLVYVATGISNSQHAKDLDVLEVFCATYPTGAGSPDIYRHMSNKGFSKRDVDAMVGELVAQNRVKYGKLGANAWSATVLE
jgi:hypothetical protein